MHPQLEQEEKEIKARIAAAAGHEKVTLAAQYEQRLSHIAAIRESEKEAKGLPTPP